MKHRRFKFLLIAIALYLPALAQDQGYFKTGTNMGVQMRLAVPDFKAKPEDPATAALLKVFNDTLWNDLDNSGIFELASKSFYPTAVPGSPQEINLAQWGGAPVNASLVAFGNLAVNGSEVMVQGWLDDPKNTQNPQVLGKEYREQATEENARKIAHRFADDIIFRMGGGINGVAETKVYFISNRSGAKEVWVMDYDGANQKQLTHLRSIALGPHISPDGSRIAFTGFVAKGTEILMYSVDLGRLVSFPYFPGTNTSPAWSSDGAKLAFSSSMRGDPEIFVTDANGAAPRRVTAFKGPDVQPVWNPKTAAQIIWVSGRTGLPQIYLMDADGGNAQRLTDEGYAVSPSWSPNGQFVAFSWIRHYGPGAPGAQDIYIMDIASKQWQQLTHDGGRNDYPSWSPDGRHLVFQSTRSGREEIWSMLADGSKQHQLTTQGSNTQPDWGSSK